MAGGFAIHNLNIRGFKYLLMRKKIGIINLACGSFKGVNWDFFFPAYLFHRLIKELLKMAVAIFHRKSFSSYMLFFSKQVRYYFTVSNNSTDI